MATVSTVSTDYLRTDHLVHNLGERALSGGLVTFTAQGIKFVLNLTSAAVLARLLSPNDFGVVGMVLAITGLLALFKDAGLSTATIQRERVTQDQVSNLFWLNILFGGLVCIVSIAFAPLVAWFYRDPRLIHIMWLLSLTFVITGSTVQHQALLTRQMRFKALAIIDVTSMFAGVIVGASLAFFGFAYWALVDMQVCVAVVTLILTWMASGWSPTPPKRNSGVRSLVSFGLHLTVADLVGCLTANTDSMLIGRSFGASALGLYSRASVLLSRPIQQVISPVAAVLVPVLSRLQSDPVRYRRTFFKVYDALVFVTFSCAAVGLVLAEPVVLLILGPRWKGAVPLFAGFALVAISAPLAYVPSWLFMSQGRGRDQLYSYLIAGPVTVGAYLVGLHWGPLGVVISLAIANPTLLLPVVYHVAGRSGPVRAADMWCGFFAFIPCWGAAYAATLLVHRYSAHAAPVVQLAVGVPFGLAAAFCMALCLKRPQATVLDARHGLTLVADMLGRRSRSRKSMTVIEQESPTLGGPSASGKRPKIALFGIFGVQNIGNEFTLQAMLYNVRQRVPEAGIYSICYDPPDTQRLHGLPALRVKCVRLSRKLPPAGNLAVKLLRGVFRRVPLELYDWGRAVRVLWGTDLLIMTGTGMLTDYCSTSLGYPYDVFKWSVAARIARCKVRFVGVGVGPIYGPLSRIFIKAALAAADYRGFRDEQSRNRLKQHGFERANDSVFPDLAFSLPTSILPASSDHAGAKPLVGIGVMKFVDMHKGESADYDAAHDRYLEKMCDFTVWLLEHGYGVRVLEGDTRHDPPVRADLKARLAKRGITYGIEDITAPEIASPQDLLHQISAVDFVVSPRFHNLVFGIMLSKPVISLGYDPKNDALLEGCGLGEYCQSIENVDLERLIAQFIQLESQADRLRGEMQRKADQYRSLLIEQYREVLGAPGTNSALAPRAEPGHVSI